jgi:hypothetical protein
MFAQAWPCRAPSLSNCEAKLPPPPVIELIAMQPVAQRDRARSPLRVPGSPRQSPPSPPCSSTAVKAEITPSPFAAQGGRSRSAYHGAAGRSADLGKRLIAALATRLINTYAYGSHIGLFLPGMAAVEGKDPQIRAKNKKLAIRSSLALVI